MSARTRPAPLPDRQHLWLPITDLTEHPANVHFNLGDLTGLAESIKRNGIIEPVIVAPLPETGYLIIDGHRRTAAAKLAGLTDVPAVLRADLATADGTTSAEHTATMLEANDHHAGLTKHERAAAYAQMVTFQDMTTAKVAKRVGVTTQDVRQAVAAAKLPRDVQTVLHTRELTLEDAAALAEFENEPKVYARLLDKLNAGAGSYVIPRNVAAAPSTRRRRPRKPTSPPRTAPSLPTPAGTCPGSPSPSRSATCVIPTARRSASPSTARAPVTQPSCVPAPAPPNP